MTQVGASIIMLGIVLLMYSLLLSMQRKDLPLNRGEVCPTCGRVIP